MGGKHKQAQRIKNNARPSSSGRCAELLATTSSFGQFSGAKEIRFLPPNLSLLKTDDFDASLAQDFQIVFKKMNKKDSTTKLKALQEFSELTANSDPEAIKAILSYWAILFSILATDTDHRVREAVHNAHQKIIAKDKKIVAPFLKQLIGPWFTSQYDTYAPAATAAQNSFSGAFPPNKVQDCVVYCQKEILNYVSENLNSKLDINAKQGTNEDAEAKFERIIISSLQGYCLYLNTLSEEQIQKCDDVNKEIISNPRFLKLATHKSTIIRATWFKVLATVYHKAAFLLEGSHEQFVPLIVGNLDETEPAVVNFVWDAMLLILDLGQEWWKHIQLDRHYLSKLRKILKEGGNGNATVIYPNLLTLLHKLPPITNLDHFYENFFESIRIGLKRKTVAASKSEFAAIVTAMVECLQYVILNNQQSENLCEKLIKLQLLPLIEWTLIESQTNYRIVFNQVVALVQYWKRNSTQENFPKYYQLFWTSMNQLFEVITADLGENPELFELIDRQIVFLQTFKHHVKPKEQMKVTFSTDSSDATNIPKVAPACTNSDTNSDLKVLTFTILKSYVDLANNKRKQAVLPYIFAIVQLFESEEFLLGLSKHLGQNESLLEIYTLSLREWLKSEDLCCETVVDLVFTICKFLKSSDKKAVLDSLLEFNERECFRWCVKNAFSHPHNEDSLMREWIKEKKVSEFLVGTIETNLKDDCHADLKILFKIAFSEDAEGELLIQKSTVDLIIEKLLVPLTNPTDFFFTMDSCAHLASYVSEIIYTENTLLKCGEELFLALFKFSLENNNPDAENLTADTLWEVKTSWQDALTILSTHLPKPQTMELVSKMSKIIETNFLDNFPDDLRINTLIESVVNLMKSVFSGQPFMMTDVYRSVFDRSFVPYCKTQLTMLCARGEHLKGNCFNPTRTINQELTVKDEQILKYFAWSWIKSSVLSANLQEEDDIDDEDVPINEQPLILSIDNNAKLVTAWLSDLEAAETLLSNYTMIRYYSNIEQCREVIKTQLKTVLSTIQIYDQIERELLKLLEVDSALWSRVIHLLASQMNPTSLIDTYKLYFGAAKTNSSKVHLIEAFHASLNFDSVEFLRSISEDSAILRSLLHGDEIDVQIAQVFERIRKFRYDDTSRFLYDNKETSWEDSEAVVEVIRLFSKLVSDKFECLSRQHWDLGVISLSSWASNCYKVRAQYQYLHIQAFMVAVADLFNALNQKIAALKVEYPKNNFVEEWEDLFFPSVHNDLVQLWLYLADQFSAKESLQLADQPLLQHVGSIVANFDQKFINRDSSLPNWPKIVKRCCQLLVNSSPILQLWGYKMLLVMVPGLVDIDSQAHNSNTPNTKGFAFEQFKSTLVETLDIVTQVLVGFRLGEDSCLVEPFTDSYTYVFGYLLLWRVLLSMCEKSPPELRYQYADLLRNDNHLKSLLNNLFKLMPAEILQCVEGAKGKTFQKLFLNEPDMSHNEPCTSAQIEHVVCWVYAAVQSQLPALVRQWWCESEPKVAQIVDRVTTLYVSPQLCNQELLDVSERENQFKNMTIKIIQSVREVIAVYTVDETHVELVITLPSNYPLGGPDVRCNRQMGGTMHKQWLMQLKKCLLHQNGRIWDGLSLWNSNLDKKFDGVEECYICFAILHPGTYQLPKLSCQTCKKKFHSACLYKWFSTSNKSSCPICRNLF